MNTNTHFVRHLFKLFCLSIAFTLAAEAARAADGQASTRKVALFVANRAERSLDDKLAAFEDFISGRITDKGFRVLSHEAVTDAVSALAKDSKQTELDQLLANNSSALRLAKMLGADYIILASLSSYGMDKQTLEALKTVNLIYNLRVTYKVLDGVQGATLTADTLKLRRIAQTSESNRIESTDVINELLDEASVAIAGSLGTKRIEPAPATAQAVDFFIACGMQDLAQLPVSVPDVRLTPDNMLVVEPNRIEVQPLDVTVEFDGAVVGSAPGVFKLAPGLHKLRLTREGFKDWERTINVVDGQRLKVVLQMTDAGYNRWKENTAFLNSLETTRKLTDAEVKRLDGEAQRLRQSGNKVDIKKDIKVDTKEGLKIYKSIY